MRCASTRVLPEPAPATINRGPPACVTAARCSGLRPSRKESAAAVVAAAASVSGRASETDILPSSLRPASVNDRLARGPSRTVCTTMDRSVATTLRTEDGLELPARWWHATDARAIVVLVHGFTASKDDPAVGAVAERMQSAGYAVMSYDARGHGASAGLS